MFQYGRNTKGSPVLADGKIYIAEVDGRFHILKPEDKSCKELYFQRFRGKALHRLVFAQPKLATYSLKIVTILSDGERWQRTGIQQWCTSSHVQVTQIQTARRHKQGHRKKEH